MKILPIILINLLFLEAMSQELTVAQIQGEVEKRDEQQNLDYRSFELNEIYNHPGSFDGSFEVWYNNREIVKIKQSIFLSNGMFLTTLYLKNEQPILISIIEKHFLWKEDNSGVDYERDLETIYSEIIYSYNWDEDPIKVVSEGKSLQTDFICGISDYIGFLHKAKNILP